MKRSKKKRKALGLAMEQFSAELDAREWDGDEAMDVAARLLDEQGLSDPHDLMRLVWSACVAGRAGKVAASVERFRHVLAAAVRECDARTLLFVVESYAVGDYTSAKTIPLAVKALFDQGVVSDSDVLEWFAEARFDPAIEHLLRPLIEWLGDN